MSSDKNDFAELLQIIKKLEKEKYELAEDNRKLAVKLKAKRYKVVDFLVDGSYSLIRRINKKTMLINRNVGAPEKKNDLEKMPSRKRKLVKGRVDIININFFDWGGNVVYKGGAERYVYDLACLLKDMGYSPRILQCSNSEFEKEFNGIKVVGIGAGDKADIRKNSAIYNYYCRDCEFVIASPLELACEITSVPVIGINHGVNFDGEWNRYDKKWPHYYNEHMDALNNVVSCVCVDTNFINWTRTQDYELSLKEVYIPNYCNAEQFGKALRKNMNKKNKNEIVFVYPRRIYSARGHDITIEAFRKVFEKLKNKKEYKIILKFVGQIDNDEARKMLDEMMRDYPENVFHFEYNMEEMEKAYEGADVVLIPTRYSEGTSLSCIEGMLSGAMVIATNVGGLPNLVIDGYNGMIVAPTSESLAEAVLEAIENSELRERIAKNGVEVAKAAFNKKSWEDKWKKVVGVL